MSRDNNKAGRPALSDVKKQSWESPAYVGALTLAGILGLAASWSAPGREIDNYVYDFFFRLHQPAPHQVGSAILGIDEATLREFGGVGGIRRALARGLTAVASAKPKVIAVDVILAEPSRDDDLLEAAFRKTPGLVLSSDLLNSGEWDDPIPRFRKLARGIGQVHAELDRYDAVSRKLPLEKIAGHERRWALALEAFRVERNGRITESPDFLDVANVRIPARRNEGRLMAIRYVPPSRGGVPAWTVSRVIRDPKLAANFAGKIVFAGVTAQTAMRDRWMTPYAGGTAMPGVEIHANAYETIARGEFITDVPNSAVVLWCAFLVTGAGIIYAAWSGARANIAAGLVLASGLVVPYFLFRKNLVLPYTPGALSAWLSVVTAAGWRHLVTRRLLAQAEVSRERYQKAMQFVTHEMRTPLTAIQGSSELITRYAMPDEKRKQIAELINAESKRLARMIETFLNVERLSAGHLDLKRERFPAPELIEQCVARVLPLAERKQIAISTEVLPDALLTGDRELMEYAIYNLLTNAVKYSPPETRVTVAGDRQRDHVRLWVEDQGIGMEQHEVRRVFEKFYRTKKAEQSGEGGSGIGLSIVEQIIEQHGGEISVESTPGKGSRFTLVLPLGSS